jgi:molybdopterin molybdotransferase
VVRELGQELSPLEEVRAQILSWVAPLPVESCALAEAWDRVLRQDLSAADAIPPFDNSAMDGYAVRSADLSAASPGQPVALPVLGTLAAGAAGRAALEKPGAIRIMTGAPLPAGADAVVPQEITRNDGSRVLFEGPVRPGQNIRRAGSDLRPGEPALRGGERLRGPQMALAAALGRASLQVTRRPRVAIISPGDELVEPGSPLGPGRIRSSNQYALIGLLRDLGVEPVPLGIVPDRREEIRAAIKRAAEGGADGVISTGGVSAGDYDFVQAIAREEGDPGRVFKVAMRPGKPQAFARIDGIPLFGLPGNPASAVISFVVLVRPALRRMLGEARPLPERFPASFPARFSYRPGRVFFLRARLEPEPFPGPAASAGAGFRVAEVGEQDSGVLSSLARANALVELPADRGVVEPGEPFPAEWIRG